MRPSHSAPLWLRVLACLTGGVLSTVFAFILFSSLEALGMGRGLFLFSNYQIGRASCRERV